MAYARVRLVADLGIGDTVETPSGRLGIVRKLGEAVTLTYTDDGDEVTLPAHLLRLVRKAQPRELRKGFFGRVEA